MKNTTGKKLLGKTVVRIAKETAKMEANSTCSFLGFQSKEPKAVQKLRKF